ncbi:MAG: peptide deformylase [Pseudomonadota bacterium]
MTLRIRLHPDPILCRVADPVPEVDEATRALIEDMMEAMYAAQGHGLAAPQIGVLRRVFVMDVAWMTGPPAPVVFVNPRILRISEITAVLGERCLSLPDRPVKIRRFTAVQVRWTGHRGTSHEAGFTGFEAACIQHEIDHLDGVTTPDRVQEG